MLEQVEALVGRDEGLQEEVNRRKEETAEVGVARQLLLEQSEERAGEKRGSVEACRGRAKDNHIAGVSSHWKEKLTDWKKRMDGSGKIIGCYMPSKGKTCS